ncbi:Transcription initiation factor TFIID subunit 4B [Plecturocebus cupreus]
MEPTASQPLRSPVGTLVTKVAPVSASPKLSSSPRLPAPQMVAVKAPTPRQSSFLLICSFLQEPFFKSNSGQLILGASSTPSNEPNLKAENSAAVQINLSLTMLENVKKCKNFLAMFIKLACGGS